MKKFFLVMAAAMLTASASAQRTAVTANKAQDNWYLGINAGVDTYLKEKLGSDGFFKSIAPTVGVRVGKNLTTVFGLALEGDVVFKSNNKWYPGSKTFIEGLSLDLMGTFNMSNLFAGYKGEPRPFEVIGLYGFGWEHDFNHLPKSNAINSRVAVDFAFNLGADKAWQLYIEPSLTYNLHNWLGGVDVSNEFQYDARNAYFGLKAGVNYKFGNSNGSHNFKIEELRDQAEIDGLNAKINEEKKEEFLQPHVIFRQGKSVIDAAQYASIEMVAKYMKNHKDAKVKVLGYASPEGNAELNQKLSEKRAEVVKNALIKKYKIAADRITCEGLGATDKLSSENDFNRVAMFIDTTK